MEIGLALLLEGATINGVGMGAGRTILASGFRLASGAEANTVARFFSISCFAAARPSRTGRVPRPHGLNLVSDYVLDNL